MPSAFSPFRSWLARGMPFGNTSFDGDSWAERYPLRKWLGEARPNSGGCGGSPFWRGWRLLLARGEVIATAIFRASLARLKSGIVQQAARLRLSPISDGEAKCRLQRNSVIRPVWPNFTNRFCADRGSEKIHPPNKTVVYRAKINNHHWHC